MLAGHSVVQTGHSVVQTPGESQQPGLLRAAVAVTAVQSPCSRRFCSEFFPLNALG